MCIISTFIDIIANFTISLKSNLASTQVRPNTVGARCIRVARIPRAFIHINTISSISTESWLTRATEGTVGILASSI